jgi:3-polyprenyl-4-hydroxybenzoate decarboxylase
MKNKNKNTITIKVTNTVLPDEKVYIPCKLKITVDRDININEWVDVFKTILNHQAFSADTISKIFNEDTCYTLKDMYLQNE